MLKLQRLKILHKITLVFTGVGDNFKTGGRVNILYEKSFFMLKSTWISQNPRGFIKIHVDLEPKKKRYESTWIYENPRGFLYNLRFYFFSKSTWIRTDISKTKSTWISQVKIHVDFIKSTWISLKSTWILVKSTWIFVKSMWIL